MIKKIIKEKGYNEFIVKDLAKLLKKTTGNVSKVPKNKLIPKGIVEVCENPTNTKKKGSTKVYRLSDG